MRLKLINRYRGYYYNLLETVYSLDAGDYRVDFVGFTTFSRTVDRGRLHIKSAADIF